MQSRHPIAVDNQEERDECYVMNEKQKSIKKSSSRKILHFTHRVHDYPRNLSFSSSSLATSHIKLNSMNQHETNHHKPYDYTSLSIGHFTEKYLPRGAPLQQLFQEMHMVIERKQSEIQTLRVYRDELKFISFNNPYSTPIRLNVKSLKGKATIESSINQQKIQLQKQIKEMKMQSELMTEFSEYLGQQIRNDSIHSQIIDIEKQEQIMIQNLQLATEHLIKALAESKKKYSGEIRQIQDQILDLRIQIKQKQDKLRDLKAKICTKYIKLHSRNSSRGKSHDRNMSFSIRKFNQSCNGMRQIFIGNNLFKPYSRQLLEKVSKEQELIKIRFIITKEDLFFQCIYQSSQGVTHYPKQNNAASKPHVLAHLNEELAKDKASSEGNTQKDCQPPHIIKQQEIFVKFLFSMKFFFKSKIVGVECRVKTDKGNKHMQIGNCDPHIEHELVTLVNRTLLTMGSYWHCKQMIGISLWYMDRHALQHQKSQKSLKNTSHKKSLKPKHTKQTYQQYYT